MVNGVGPPLLPLATVVFGALAPLVLVSLVIAEVATGFVVVQEKLIVQELAPVAMTQFDVAGVRVPDMGDGGGVTHAGIIQD